MTARDQTVILTPEKYSTHPLQGDGTRSVTYIVAQNPALVLARLLTEDTLLVNSAGELLARRGDMQLFDTNGATWAIPIREFLSEYDLLRRYVGDWPPAREAAALPGEITAHTFTTEDRVYLARRATLPGTAFQTYTRRVVYCPGQPHPLTAREQDWIVVCHPPRRAASSRVHSTGLAVHACDAQAFHRFYTIMRQAEPDGDP